MRGQSTCDNDPQRGLTSRRPPRVDRNPSTLEVASGRPVNRRQPAALRVNPFRVQLGSFGANPIQEEVNGSLSMPLLGFWIRCDAIECKAFGVPEHNIEEHVSGKFRVIHLDLTAGSGLTQYT